MVKNCDPYITSWLLHSQISFPLSSSLSTSMATSLSSPVLCCTTDDPQPISRGVLQCCLYSFWRIQMPSCSFKNPPLALYPPLQVYTTLDVWCELTHVSSEWQQVHKHASLLVFGGLYSSVSTSAPFLSYVENTGMAHSLNRARHACGVSEELWVCDIRMAI